ncbi:MAG: hypothetical protein AB7K09_13335 [Planctomycetota bacterium]
MTAQSVDAYLLFGRLAVKFGLLAPDALRQVVEKQVQLAAQKKKFTIGEVAVRLKLMTDEQRKQILQGQAAAPVKQEGSYFGYLSLVNGFVKQKQLALALKKQEEAGPDHDKLGDIFKADKLMTEGQVQAILAAQARIRKRVASATSTAIPKPGSAAAAAAGGKAAEALARLAQFEKQFGGMVEVSLDLEEEEAVAEAEPATASAAAAGGNAAGGVLPLPPPPKGIYSTLASGELEVVWGGTPEDAEEDVRFADPAPADGAINLDADDDSGFGNWGADADVEVEVGVGGSSSATRPKGKKATDDLPALNIDVDDVQVEIGGAPSPATSDLPQIDAPVGGGTNRRPAPAAKATERIEAPGKKPATKDVRIETPGTSKLPARPVEGLVSASEGDRFKGRRKEQPAAVEQAVKPNYQMIILVAAVGVMIMAYILSSMLLAK